MKIIEASQHALKNYAVFSSRTSRAEFWWFILAAFIVSFVVSFIAGIIGMPIISTLYSLAILVPTIAVGIRRMHDVGKSGWFILIPIYNIILAATPSEPQKNVYGDAPKV